MVARSRGPFYKLAELVKDCKKKGQVRVRTQAKADAKKFFNLETELKILSFVANGVFENIEHDNTDKLDSDPDKGTIFDAYIFRIGPVKHVYFAFFKRANGTWIIKSFHPPEFGGKVPFHLPFDSLKEIK
jgi:hypothetical protein